MYSTHEGKDCSDAKYTLYLMTTHRMLSVLNQETTEKRETIEAFSQTKKYSPTEISVYA